MKVFIFQDWPSRNEAVWTTHFADELRIQGFDVTQEWSLPRPLPAEDVERGLRESDAIVFFVSNAPDTERQSLFFHIGVALFGEKDTVVVAPRSLPDDRLPIPPLENRLVRKSTPRRTAVLVAHALRQAEKRQVA